MDSLKERISKINQILTLFSDQTFQNKINQSAELIINALNQSLPILICGNGGSASDSQHIAGELVGRFLKERKALNVRSLSTDTSIITAWSNDYSFDTIFSRQVEAYGCRKAVLLAISTSGKSKNILNAIRRAKELEMFVISLTGDFQTEISQLSDVTIAAPSKETPRIQEIHLIAYHYLCEKIENEFI